MVSRFRNSLGVGNIHQFISVHMTSWGFLLHLQSWTRTPWICVFLEFAKAIEVKKLHVHFEFLDFSDERSPAFHMHEMWFGLCIRTLGAPPPTNSRHNCYNFCMWSLQTPRLNVPLLVRGNTTSHCINSFNLFDKNFQILPTRVKELNLFFPFRANIRHDEQQFAIVFSFN